MFIYVVRILLLLLLLIFVIIFLLNQRRVIITFKIIKREFFFDLDLIFNIWRFIFLIIVLMITIRVIYFSFSYIRVYSVQNFIFLYLRFVLRIFWLILNNNFYWIIFGWDGLGVVSFLLIIYYINFERVTNGLFTIFQNRVGDLFFVLFILFILSTRNVFNIVLKIGLLFLILGACVKRAQFPFNSWLLAAIRAPTPISSLVHSSTLVVAGVYILLQYSYCLKDWLLVLKLISLITLIIRFFGLLNERDMKKLIAFSTISHVGLMLFLLRIQLFKVTFFHLNIHAIFKSLMFMCFGFTILNSFHSQDKRLVRYMSISPIIKIIYYFACFCLMGLPFLSGFFSKDFIIEKSIEISVEMRDIFLLMMFLRVRIYYRLKLISLFKPIYVIRFNETQLIGMVGLIIILVVRIVVINIFIRIIFSISLEIMSFKLVVYFFILCFLLLRILSNLNYKWNSYFKIANSIEIWIVNWYALDQFMYWTIINVVFYVTLLNNVKYILLINWWVLVLFIVVIYNVSFKSVALKKLRICYNFLRCIACIIFVNKV